MSEFTLGQKGTELVEKRHYEEAIPMLSKAIKSIESPAWLLARSHAYQQTKQLDKALIDAELAYIKATERQQPQSRSQMILAQYRRAVIFFKQGRYADSDACCIWSMQLIEGKNFRTEQDAVCKNVDAEGDYIATLEDAKSTETMPKSEPGAADPNSTKNQSASQWTRAYVWRTQTLTAMQKLEKGAPGRKITALRVPKKPTLVHDEPAEAPTKKTTSTVAQGKQPEAQRQAPKNSKLRVDFYQTSNKVNLTIYIKGVDKTTLAVRCSDDKNVVLENLPRTGIASGTASLELSNPVNPDSTSFHINVTPHKIELSMEKAQVGQKWGTWGKQNDESDASPSSASSESALQAVALESTAPKAPETTGTASEKIKENEKSTKPTGPPAYPTSSKTGPKDWEHVGDDDVEDESMSDVNGFFKSLYAGSTPEQQRAMMKSFVESNGTTLSTDWNDVKDRFVETHPPDGVEAKKWD